MYHLLAHLRRHTSNRLNIVVERILGCTFAVAQDRIEAARLFNYRPHAKHTMPVQCTHTYTSLSLSM